MPNYKMTRLICFPRRRYYSYPGIVGISQRLHLARTPKLFANLNQRFKFTRKNIVYLSECQRLDSLKLKLMKAFKPFMYSVFPSELPS